MTDLRKCTVVGFGAVGASIAFALCQQGIFSEIVLSDADREKAVGEALDPSHAISYSYPAQIRSGSYADTAGAYLVVIAAGSGQRPGESRLDLAGRSVGILREILVKLLSCSDECILLLAANPVDVLTCEALLYSGFPAGRVIGSGTVLDTGRLKYLLGSHFGVDSRSVHAFVIGKHGDSELAVWSSANISGMDLELFPAKRGEGRQVLSNLFEEVRASACTIIQAKDATCRGIALAALRIIKALVGDEKSVLTVSALLEGQWGRRGIRPGAPAIIGRRGIEEVLEIPLSPEEGRLLAASAGTMREAVSRAKAGRSDQ